ncbi:MAG: adenylate/guanylate cyclase domain-containing protein [Hyphomicrobiales bacterium]|nr:adenylate/guanylate cyclase domain-containing protein [Hyphomicrobiales bacterium]
MTARWRAPGGTEALGRRVRAAARWRLWLGLVAAAAVLGGAYSTLTNLVADHPLLPWYVIEGLAYGALIGGVWGFYHLFLEQGALLAGMRRLSFAANVAVSAMASTAVVVLTYLAARVLMTPVARDLFGMDGSGHPLFSEATLQDMVFALLAMLFLEAVLRVRRIIGARVLANFVRGRYHRPLREERVFLFIDLTGSTRLARELGDERAQEMVTRFFFDVDQVTTAFGAETHRYIGDEVVVTWPLDAGRRDGACLACLAAVRARLAARAADYERRYGAAPRFRAALHGGPVVAAECGDSKHEIVYFGDTINTAARIAAQCKALDRSWLVSRSLLDGMALPPGLGAETAARVTLTGHAHETELVAIAEVTDD